LDEDYVEGSELAIKPPEGLECCYRHIERRAKDDSNIKYVTFLAYRIISEQRD
jgi:hypothetical protein